MFVQFLIAASAIFVVGPIHIEGGAEAIQQKGLKPSIEMALSQRDVSALKGNYGNK